MTLTRYLLKVAILPLVLVGIVACTGDHGFQSFFSPSSSPAGPNVIPDAYVYSNVTNSSQSANLTMTGDNHPFSFLSTKAPTKVLFDCLLKLKKEGHVILQHQTDSGFLFTIDRGLDPYSLPSKCNGESGTLTLAPGELSTPTNRPFNARLNFRRFLLPQLIQQEIYEGSSYFLVAASDENSSSPVRAFSPSVILVGQGGPKILSEVYFTIKSTINKMLKDEKFDFYLFKQISPGNLEQITVEDVKRPNDLPAYVVPIENFHLVAKRWDELPNCTLENTQQNISWTPFSLVYYVDPQFNPYDLTFICNSHPPRFARRLSIPMITANADTRPGPPVEIEVNFQTNKIIPDPQFQATLGDQRNQLLIAELTPKCCGGSILRVPIFQNFGTTSIGNNQSVVSFGLGSILFYLQQYDLARFFFLHQAENNRFTIIPNTIRIVPKTVDSDSPRDIK